MSKSTAANQARARRKRLGDFSPGIEMDLAEVVVVWVCKEAYDHDALESTSVSLQP